MPYSNYLWLIRNLLFILITTWGLSLFSQEKKPKYYRKEEILNEGKRYRLYNNYLTFGLGYGISSIRDDVQKNAGLDFNFHIKRQYFQAGIIMSGAEFLANNNIQAHVGYGLRKENQNVNMSIYGGISYYTGVIGVTDSTYGSIPKYYEGVGIYASALIVKKITYDIGAGLEMFGEYSKNQSVLGFRFVLFFSGAYKGPKQNYNPNVRAENKQ